MVPATWRRAILAGTLLLFSSVASRAATDAPEACREGTGVAIWTSPRQPVAGGPLRILAVADAEPASELAITDPNGQEAEPETVHLGGPPWSLAATITSARTGTYRIEVARRAKVKDVPDLRNRHRAFHLEGYQASERPRSSISRKRGVSFRCSRRNES